MADYFYLSQPPQFSFSECRWFLDRKYDECLHQTTATTVTKAVLLDGQPTVLTISEKATQLLVQVVHGQPSEEAILTFIREWFDLDTDIFAFYEQLQQDADLSFLATDYYGLRLMGIPDLFEALCWCVIGQQINLTFAYALKRRLVERWGEKLTVEHRAYYLFPSPERLAALSVEELRALQFSTRKAEYIIGIAQLFSTNSISKEQLQQLPEAEIFNRLTAIRGVGEWTAQYVMMKSLRLPNSVPYGDVGLYNALHHIKQFEKRPTRQKLDEFFQPFEGWKSYLTLYLWRTLAQAIKE